MSDSYWEKIGEEARRARAERDKYATYKPTPTEKHERAARKRLYVCTECNCEKMEPWLIRTRAARPRCSSCGSLAYGPKTKEAREDIIDLKDIRKSFKGPTGTGGSGFVIGQ